jgi:hypothetical protein
MLGSTCTNVKGFKNSATIVSETNFLSQQTIGSSSAIKLYPYQICNFSCNSRIRIVQGLNWLSRRIALSFLAFPRKLKITAIPNINLEQLQTFTNTAKLEP